MRQDQKVLLWKPKAIALLLMFVVWAAASLQFASIWNDGRFNQDGFVFADVASAYNLALDIVADPISVLYWDLPSANYLFPEQILLLPWAALGLPLDTATPLYLAGFLFWLGIGTFALARAELGYIDSSIAACVTISIAAMLPSLSVFPGARIASPNFHAGIILALPLVLAAATRLRARYSHTWALVLLISLGLICYSDRLALVQISVPLLLALALLAALSPDWRKPRRTLLILAALIILASVLGQGTDTILRPDVVGSSPRIALDRFLTNSAEIWRLSGDLRRTFPWLAYAIPASPVLALAALAWHASLPRAALPLLAFMAFYYPIMQLVHAGSDMAPVSHYRTLDVILPLIIYPVLLMLLLRAGYVRIALRIASLSIPVLTMFLLPPMWARRGNGETQLVPFIRCLDLLAAKHDLHYGAAEYWQAVPVQALSRAGLIAISAGPNLRPRRWNQTTAIDPDRPYDFLVLDPQFPIAVHATLRQPVTYETCGDKLVGIAARE